MRFDERARGWVEEVAGCSAVRVRRMRGGLSSVVHEVALADGRRVVLRRTRGDPGMGEAIERAATEVAALARLDRLALVPRLLAVDPDGQRCGAPAVLASRLPGRPWVAPGRHVDAWVDGLATALRTVHELDDPGDDLPSTGPWLEGVERPPAWSEGPDAWAWALATVRDGLPPGGPDRLLHRDMHPANVLFSRRRLTGIVDWEVMCRGPAELDVARCRVQVALLGGPDAADALLARVADLAPAYGPAWDALVACELSRWTDELLVYNALGASLTLPAIRAGLDGVVARARAAGAQPS